VPQLNGRPSRTRLYGTIGFLALCVILPLLYPHPTQEQLTRQLEEKMDVAASKREARLLMTNMFKGAKLNKKRYEDDQSDKP